MRIASLLPLVGGAVLACTATHANSPDLPKRKPGHWEITTVSTGTGMTTSARATTPS